MITILWKIRKELKYKIKMTEDSYEYLHAYGYIQRKIKYTLPDTKALMGISLSRGRDLSFKCFVIIGWF